MGKVVDTDAQFLPGTVLFNSAACARVVAIDALHEHPRMIAIANASRTINGRRQRGRAQTVHNTGS